MNAILKYASWRGNLKTVELTPVTLCRNNCYFVGTVEIRFGGIVLITRPSYIKDCFIVEDFIVYDVYSLLAKFQGNINFDYRSI